MTGVVRGFHLNFKEHVIMRPENLNCMKNNKLFFLLMRTELVIVLNLIIKKALILQKKSQPTLFYPRTDGANVVSNYILLTPVQNILPSAFVTCASELIILLSL